MTWHGTMDQRVDGTVTARQVCEAAAKAGDAKSRASLVPPPLPDHLAYLWVWWLDVSTGEPLTYRDIHAWSDMTGVEPSGWEVATLLMMDRTYRTQQAGTS